MIYIKVISESEPEDGDYSILRKSVIPNLLQENFQPTFITDVPDTCDILYQPWSEPEPTSDYCKQNAINEEEDECFEDSNCTLIQEEPLHKRTIFKESVDFRKTLGNNISSSKATPEYPSY